MGEIGRAMLKVGLVTEGQLKQAEKDTVQEMVDVWRKKYGDHFLSKLLFMTTFSQGGKTAVKEMLEK
jgi:hypothetical protein